MRRNGLTVLFFCFATLCQNTAAWAEPDSTAKVAEPAKSDSAPQKKYSVEAVAHYNRAVDLHQQGFLNQAIVEYKLAIDADNRVEQAWMNLGGIYAAQLKYAEAEKAFQKSIDICQQLHHKPGRQLLPLFALASVYCAQGKYAQAEPLYKRALNLSDADDELSYPYMLHGYADLLRKTQRAAEADKLEQNLEKLQHVEKAPAGDFLQPNAKPLTEPGS